MSKILEFPRWMIHSARYSILEAIKFLHEADDALSGMCKSNTVQLPCKFGDRLWWCYLDDDDDGKPKVERSGPVNAFLIEPDGLVKVSTDNGETFDPVGGPSLYLTENEAREECGFRTTIWRQEKKEAD